MVVQAPTNDNMAILPMHTEGIVVEDVQSGFGLKAVVLDNMRPDEILIEMRYTGICHTVSSQLCRQTSELSDIMRNTRIFSELLQDIPHWTFLLHLVMKELVSSWLWEVRFATPLSKWATA